eukprot:1184729-Prorocentrum_minimum.AAC.1
MKFTSKGVEFRAGGANLGLGGCEFRSGCSPRILPVDEDASDQLFLRPPKRHPRIVGHLAPEHWPRRVT